MIYLSGASVVCSSLAPPFLFPVLFQLLVIISAYSILHTVYSASLEPVSHLGSNHPINGLRLI